MPISDKQREANRANATHATGPRTPEGKARSAQNARRHGFTASTFAVVRLEDLNEAANLTADLTALYQPVNSQELFALERVALAQQTLLRAARLESGLFTTCLDQALDCGDPIVPMTPDLAGDGDIEITRAPNRNYALAVGFHRMTKQSNSWALFLRYQAQAERLYRRAIEEFERLEAQRLVLPNEPILPEQPEESEPTCTPRNEPISHTGPTAALNSEQRKPAVSDGWPPVRPPLATPSEEWPTIQTGRTTSHWSTPDQPGEQDSPLPEKCVEFAIRCSDAVDSTSTRHASFRW